MDGENTALASLLERAGWTPEHLGAQLTRMFEASGDPRWVHAKTPYSWLRGKVPRPPIPEMVALALSEELGENIPFEAVWPATAKRSPQWLPATAGLAGPWTQTGTVDTLGKWVTHMRRREFVAVSGAALAAPVWDWADAKPAALTPAVRGAKVTPEVVSLLGAQISTLRRLDDVHGGSPATLRYVGAQFDLVADLLAHGSYDAALGKRLLGSLAELGQFGGFTAFEAEQHGKAQRYYLNALRAAHAAGDRELGVYIVRWMVYQAAYCGRTNDALPLAAAAERSLAGASAKVRAAVEVSLGKAHAVAGDLSGFRRHQEQALEWVTRRSAEAEPSWIYWMNKEIVNGSAVSSLVTLAAQMPDRLAGRLVEEAAGSLRPDALAGPNDGYRRDALLLATWLAQGQAHAGELDQAVATGRQALALLPGVTSPRCRSRVRAFRDSIRQRWPRERRTREFVTDLDHTLTTAA